MSKLKLKYPESQHDSTTDDDPDTEDQGDIIRCVCKSTNDDGFTIQCEQCDTWQHAKCVNIKKKAIPEHYICDRCNKRLKKTFKSNVESESIKDRKKKPLKRDNKKKRLIQQEHEQEEPTKRKKFASVSKIIMKEKLVQDLFIEVHRQWIELNRPTKKNNKSETSTATTSNNNSSNKGLDSIIVMESNLLLPAIPKASVKPIRKSLRSSFSYRNDPSVQKGIFADIHIPPNRYLMQVTGEASRKSEYKADTRNHYNLLGTPLPRVFFYPSLDICVDARYTGNDARFVRRSCCPNSEIKSIILPNDNEDQTVHMGIYTKDEVDKGEEITIGWNWQKGHIMWKKNKQFKDMDSDHIPDIMDQSEKNIIRETLDLIHNEFGKCACEDEEDCLLEYLKDELEREPSPSKKKSKKQQSTTPVNSIFTSDEENEDQEEEKDIKLKSDEKTSLIIPTVPLDIVPTASSSEIISGYKRARPIPNGIKLPCKKKWLHDYIQQQTVKEKVPVSIPSPIAPTTELEPVFDEEGELSDGASSQSTLPLDDTPTIEQPAEHVNLSEKELIQDDPASPNHIVQEPLDEMDTTDELDTDMSNKIKTAESITIEADKSIMVESEKSTTAETDNSITVTEPVSNKTLHTESKSSTEDPPVPKVKLSIQEYLKRQRGNLPTPDEKH
ncbi:hypothetical protein BDF21DRAFT_419189 [Thamnidium elegans]|uniref:SET domain-containing protein n=1 Tax=Thamnidium elegans TaxID=101142 RepID=A0A8H7T098_9FUNG|nr:hypothetical protein INT48_009631 [Thamnidium elegans]KAI8080528.1 hypothetical protein BDF21DRAFT_419189 [Thamnidium elegans]